MEVNPYGIESLWQQGDLVIKSVAILLLLMSIATWSIFLVRAWGLWRQHRYIGNLAGFWCLQSFEEGINQLGPRTEQNIFRHLAEEGGAALNHHRHHNNDLQAHLPLNEWLSSSLKGAMDEGAEQLQYGLPVLASVGATAPFIGLFGTVWGIYHALVSIGISGQASIDKIAGPVGEALIMTALGLAVAIPAVLAYNALVRANKKVLGKLNRFARQLYAYLLTGAAPMQEAGRSVSPLETEIGAR
ncbi:MAG TPA: MotA/TolQ/ExbB proton channel family protein [Gammaproteobacteria bacterium]|nr:MotA/TolQ/ExbB proton channel family protein [Gammaproteobacteria bacterium]